VSPAARLWRALTRPRGWGGQPARGRRSGVAILMVLATLMVLVVVTSELTYGARVRFLVAAHHQERVQSYWLARSGFNLYRIVLVANKELGRQAQGSSFLPAEIQAMIGDALWQMIPSISTGMLRMLLGAGGDVDDIAEEDMEAFQQTGRAPADPEAEEQVGRFSDRSFLDFDGDYNAEVQDHESKINLNAFAVDTSPTVTESALGKALFAMMSGPENDQWFYERGIDRWEIISNLKDWVDADNVRSGLMGGYEDNLYNRLTPPYLTKNAPFDSLAEVALVDGWQGEVYDRYIDQLTVFGAGDGKVNYKTAEDLVIYASLAECLEGVYFPDMFVQTLERLSEQDLLFIPSMMKPKQYVDALVTAGVPLNAACAAAKLTEDSKTFTITSTGMVGNSSVTVTAVLDFTNSTEGDLLYWRVD
jgi:type II secretory pathway component PulK